MKQDSGDCIRRTLRKMVPVATDDQLFFHFILFFIYLFIFLKDLFIY